MSSAVAHWQSRLAGRPGVWGGTVAPGYEVEDASYPAEGGWAATKFGLRPSAGPRTQRSDWEYEQER